VAKAAGLMGFWLPVLTLLAVAAPVFIYGLVRPPRHRHERD
jgi:hypothetical protein